MNNQILLNNTIVQNVNEGMTSIPVLESTCSTAAPGCVNETDWVAAATEQSEVDGQAAVQEPPVVEEKSIQEQILDLQDSIQFLEQIWNQEPDIQQEMDPNAWKGFMDSVYQSLSELETQQVGNTEVEE
jgi:hypothetical protein